MIPTSSSGATNGCDNISSNCVIWQGPDIPCIDLCTGDTISEVSAKIGNKVCQIITDGVSANPSLTGLEIGCLVPGVPPTELVPVLNTMILQICQNSQSLPDPVPGADLPMMSLPPCLQYNDPSGNPVTELRLDDFAEHVANQVCTNLAAIEVINTTLTSLNDRIVILENCVLPCTGAVAEAQIIPTCILPSALTDVSVVVLAIEAAFCSLQDATGTPAQINLAIGQSSITGVSNSLTSSSVSYGSIPGWNQSPINLAQSVQNAWVVIDDLYSALADVQSNCCATSGCDSVVFAFTSTAVLSAQGLIANVNLNFTSSSIPATFSDVTGFSKVKITDVNGSSVVSTFSVASEQSNANGVLIGVSTLDTSSDLTVNINFRVFDGIDTCSATQTQTVAGVVPCLTPTVASVTGTEVNVVIGNNLGSAITLKIEIVDAITGIVAATRIVNSPTTNVDETLTGLTAGTTYNIRLTITTNGVDKVCPDVQFTTVRESKDNCNGGIDIVFALDYSPSMLNTIQTLQNTFSSVVTNIMTQPSVGNKYRIGISTVDESVGIQNSPPYGACTSYIQLANIAKRSSTTQNGNTIFFTSWEDFSDDNGGTAIAQLGKLANGASGQVGGCVQMGEGGANSPDPTDQLLGQILLGQLNGAFRGSAIQKVIVLMTDALPSGDDDFFDATDVAYLNQLAQSALSAGVLIYVVGAGVNGTYTPPGGGTVQYPWRDLATATNGQWSVNADSSTIVGMINVACGVTPQV